MPESLSQNLEGMGMPGNWDLGFYRSPKLESLESFFKMQYFYRLFCVWISRLLWNPLLKFADLKGVPGVGFPDPASHSLGNNQSSPQGERMLAAGRKRGYLQETLG